MRWNTTHVSERKNCFDTGEYNYSLYCGNCLGRPKLCTLTGVISCVGGEMHV